MADPVAPVSTAIPAARAATHFDTALRGYDRRQVETFVTEKDAATARLENELADTRRRLTATAEHVEYLENELRQRPAAGSTAPSGDEGFGLRAEKLLRLAEQEAAELRSQAGADSTAIIEQARTEAEKHRHEIEQDLISRASAMEQQASRRANELQEREQQVADQLNSARDQAEQLHATAVRAADRLREEAAAAAEETKLRAESTAKRLVDQANQEVARLSNVQGNVRSELARLAEVLTKEMG